MSAQAATTNGMVPRSVHHQSAIPTSAHRRTGAVIQSRREKANGRPVWQQADSRYALRYAMMGP